MVKKKLKKLQQKREAARETHEQAQDIPKITNENVAEHREEVLSGARKYIYPLQHSKHRIVLWSTILVIAAVLVLSTVLVMLLYRQQSTSRFIYQVSRVVPFPVARIGNSFVDYENYLFELRHYIHYYESQEDLSFMTEEGAQQLASYKNRALDDVVNHAYVKQIAKELDISVSTQDVDEQIRIAREQSRLGSTDDILEDVVREYWNWSITDFRRSLASELLVQKVTRALDTEAQQVAEQALADLDGGADFADVAKEYSQDEASAQNGGEFGEVDASDRNVSQATVDTLLRLEEGEYSGVTVIPYRTGYALAIIKNVEDKGSSARGAHIVIPLQDVSETLNDRKEDQPYRLYISLPEQ